MIDWCRRGFTVRFGLALGRESCYEVNGSEQPNMEAFEQPGVRGSSRKYLIIALSRDIGSLLYVLWDRLGIRLAHVLSSCLNGGRGQVAAASSSRRSSPTRHAPQQLIAHELLGRGRWWCMCRKHIEERGRHEHIILETSPVACAAIGRLGMPVIHLDRVAHLMGLYAPRLRPARDQVETPCRLHHLAAPIKIAKLNEEIATSLELSDELRLARDRRSLATVQPSDGRRRRGTLFMDVLNASPNRSHTFHVIHRL